jgi:hypothetical protein
LSREHEHHLAQVRQGPRPTQTRVCVMHKDVSQPKTGKSSSADKTTTATTITETRREEGQNRGRNRHFQQRHTRRNISNKKVRIIEIDIHIERSVKEGQNEHCDTRSEAPKTDRKNLMPSQSAAAAAAAAAAATTAIQQQTQKQVSKNYHTHACERPTQPSKRNVLQRPFLAQEVMVPSYLPSHRPAARVVSHQPAPLPHFPPSGV